MPEIWERVSPSASAYFHDVEKQAPARRLQAWRDLMHDRSLGTVRNADADGFRGSIEGQSFDGGILARWTLSRQTLIRTPEIARKLDDEYVFVSVMVGGQGVHDVGTDACDLKQGDFTVVDATRAFNSVTSSPLVTKGFLHVHRSALRQRLGARDENAFGAYKAGSSPLQKLAFGFLRDLTGLVGHVDPVRLSVLAGQALDLIALLADEARPGIVEHTTHRSAMLFRLKAHINAHLRDSLYDLEGAAAALGVTARYVNALLAHEGRSFGRYLLECRLKAAYRDIVDPRNLHRQITEIAFDWGFNNVSHFGKVFKDRYDMTPRDAKTAGMLAAVRAT